MRKLANALLVVTALAIGPVGCGDDDDGDSAGTTVDAVLSDFKIELSKSSAPAGPVTFDVDNKGPATHEFVIFKTDLKSSEVPTDGAGDVAENDQFAPLDEIEDIASGSSPSLTVDLTPGHYVILCNVPAHFRQGMRTEFNVT